jgi:hypothetical protein
MLSGYTEELYDVYMAIGEVQQTLDLEGGLLSHSFGILHCNADFVDNGFVEAICDVMPFEIVGSTTTTQGVNHQITTSGLSLTVFTSDDAEFHTGMSAAVGDDMPAAVSGLYGRLIAPLRESPKLLLSFVPFMATIGGDEFVNQLNELTEYQAPVFGTLPISNEADYSRCYTLYNGKAYTSSLVLVAITGNLVPTFISSVIYDENLLAPTGTATASFKNILAEIDGIPAEQFLVNAGLAQPGGLANLVTMPFVVDMPSGERIIRSCLSGDGNGGAILCGNIPVGGKISFVNMSFDEVMRSAGEVAELAEREAQGRGILLYSCAARGWALGADTLAELRLLQATILRSSFQGSCSGGEIFPQWLEDGRVVNRPQNASLTVCIL